MEDVLFFLHSQDSADLPPWVLYPRGNPSCMQVRSLLPPTWLGLWAIGVLPWDRDPCFLPRPICGGVDTLDFIRDGDESL